MVMGEEVTALHRAWRRPDPGQAEHGRGKIDAADQLVVNLARIAPVRETHHQGNAEAVVVEELLATEEWPVIARDHDDGVLRQPVVFQALQELREISVGQMNGIKIVGVFIPGDRMIGIIGRQLQLVRIDEFRLGLLPRELPAEALVGFEDGDVREEWLPRTAFVPADPVERVPRGVVR